MNAEKVLKECRSKGVTLEAVNGQILYRAPKGVMTEELKKRVKEHKQDLISFLSVNLPSNYYDKHIEAVIAELNFSGLRWTDIPESTTKRASELELTLTEAAHANDQGEFLRLLKKWRRCFH